ncbi:hypothetical protein [Pseudomonas sp. GM80]|uniref:hypothetical protein n=1 Tax=Pseudomonas sp. GM80 TaxID=1144339 RepID=UPI00026F95B8|nr:hypothetical protein [Pseudomonas sp. GM80]EJN18691.1 hypothetical protein PMI37_05721 [Pseudomonas sp. GM80]
MQIGQIEIKLDKKWELQDFSVYTKEYVQIYSLFYVLQSVIDGERDEEFGYSGFQWRGGYSVVNFFRSAYSLTPEEDRLQIRRIQYASPGVIELTGMIGVATDIATIVAAFCGSVLAVNRTYDMVMRGYHQRKLARLEVQAAESKLAREDVLFIRNSVKALAADFNLKPEQVKALGQITDGNELIQLKILMALYRRAEPLQKQQSSGKAQL